MSTQTTHLGDIGVVGLLGVLFVGLKLGGVIDWSWWWVTAPFWGSAVFALVLLAIIFALAFVATRAEERAGKAARRRRP